MNKILITYDPSFSNEILNDRIRNVGRSFNFYRNQWVVETEMTSKQVYERLSAGEFESLTMLVVEISDTNYYGRMNTALWDWFSQQ